MTSSKKDWAGEIKWGEKQEEIDRMFYMVGNMNLIEFRKWILDISTDIKIITEQETASNIFDEFEEGLNIEINKSKDRIEELKAEETYEGQLRELTDGVDIQLKVTERLKSLLEKIFSKYGVK